MATFITFWVLFALTLASKPRLRKLLDKSRGDWLLDVTGLLVQGALIPVLQIVGLYALYGMLVPQLKGVLQLPLVVAFALNFLAVDYLYYWNHRLLHRPGLWPIHIVHHTVTEMDVLGTSRNTLWSSFFILYVWVNSVVIFVLAEPTGYIIAASATACLDLWRHSAVQFRADSVFERGLRTVLITPRDHAQHHAAEGLGNYGANLNVWDRMHGTYQPGPARTPALGVSTQLSLGRKLLWPFSGRSAG